MIDPLYVLSFVAGFGAGMGSFRLVRWGWMALVSRPQPAVREPMRMSRAVPDAELIRVQPRVMVQVQSRKNGKSTLPDNWMTPGTEWTPPARRVVDGDSHEQSALINPP